MLVASGCGNPDSPTGLEWTSTAPAFSSDVVEPPGQNPDPTQPAPEENLAEDVATSAISPAAVNTTIVPTTVPATATTESPVTSTAPDPEVTEESVLDQPLEEVPNSTTTQETEERLITQPGAVMANDYWADLGFPDPAVPPVEDPGRIRYAEGQLRKIYFKWTTRSTAKILKPFGKR